MRIVLQARTTSTRLPAKVLLPIGGIPLAVLCAKRLGNASHEVILATSDEASDDALAGIVAGAGIRLFRGNLDHVLSRFIACTADLQDDDIVVRTTADNPLPDGQFVGRLVEAFEASGMDYLGTSSPADGLPYGLSAEVFHVGALRAFKDSGLPEDQEHVTYSLRQRSGSSTQVRPGMFLPADCSSMRATVDTLADYLAMTEVFRYVAAPQEIAWSDLVPALPQGATVGSPSAGRASSAAPVMLGTAQLGSSYGIANRIGQPSPEQARELVYAAIGNGVEWLDTARVYGDAEQRLGALGLPARIRIVTKLAPLSALPDTCSVLEIDGAVDASIAASRLALGRAHLDVLMFHRAADVFRWRGRALERLQVLTENGTIGEIGVSVYSLEEALQCLGEPRITQLQIPFNLLDPRWLAEPLQSAIAARPELRIHVRSVFLQGLLINEASIWPKWVENPAKWVTEIQALCTELHRESPADLCMAYVLGYPWVASLVLGAESAAQVEELLQLARRSPLSPQEQGIVQRRLDGAPRRLLNPAEWNA